MIHVTDQGEMYVLKENKKMQCGYTTGSCAAAAAKAAARMLLTQERVDQVDLMTPKGILLHLEAIQPVFDRQKASCAIRKDGGDDPDATHGMLIFASVEFTDGEELVLDGGKGVGRVTKPGLWQKVGEAAINRVPREMILASVEEVRREYHCTRGMKIIISAPEGEKVAEKTFNPRLGILGGISILGTSGIVVPMSEAALTASIRLEINMYREQGADYLLITPGNYGESFLKEKMDLDMSHSLKCSNYVGETLEMAVDAGIKGILFVSHIGKFIKVSGGIMNTHSHQADCRAELMAAQAIRAGADLETAQRILKTLTTEEAVDILLEKQLCSQVMEIVTDRVYRYLQHHCQGALETEAILFSNKHGYLGETKGAQEMLKKFVIKTE
ncbi:MAG: cobalt-precorrin-5B (C(1))-methyltransferase CbiD [Eubacteriales bacterium]|nr:cobalt-precorrin-5B (C(1))-methyltransferase CbiD [Eubacteriales bacterium]